MKAHYKTADGRMQFEVTGETPKAIFEQIANVQELFEAERECGVCHKEEIRFRVRAAESKDGKRVKYYELLCLTCFARFQFGQAQEGGGLFPKRTVTDASGKKQTLPNRGWAKYERKQQAGASTGPVSKLRQSSTAEPPPREYEYAAGVTDDDVPF